eukprot:TRINITY_DN88161_c0_g1_i1.p1 TRINITY_DN88161_c0_g1~~TRINITY_DN88161_c0_g1_i1.p1  ORF type:complete len:113 (-),score=6.90 TRINITY_DN88161_c0_g1_i1:105-413(-)
MGGSPEHAQFKWFMQQATRAYLACRQHQESIVTLVSLMLDTGFHCFKEPTIANLRSRFLPGADELSACEHFTKQIIQSFSTSGTFFTYFYDKFQNMANGIDM